MPNNPTGFFDNEYPYTDFHELNLSWVLKQIKDQVENIKALNDWKTQHEEEYEELKELYDQVMSGDFPPSIVQAFEDWMSRNAIDLVGKLVKTVHFGLTNDGYFCAWIPEAWSDVQFDTVTDFDDPLYGHLMLLYD